jgi:CheY-like chemotaxis protein
MPGMDGLELVARYRLHPATHDIPVVVLSTKEDAQVKSDAFKAGANDYLVKLPDKIELLARIRYHSKAYRTQIERDQAFRALQESQRQLMQANAALLSSNQRLEAALEQVTQLQGLLPICCFCKQIRDDKNYWSQVDSYFAHHSAVRFTHGICPACLEKNYGEWMTSREKIS